MFDKMDHLQAATSVVRKLQESGFIAYFAGGWVRDHLMNHPSDDIDIATSASVTQVQQLFTKTIPVGVAFGIVIVVEEGHQFEVATFRKDRGYVDGRRPIGIDPATPEEDAMRRDFTINGLFYDPLQSKIYDFVGGEKDIKKGIVRAIGDPLERFAEDRLRMMRAVRYSTRFNFPIESDTLQAILSHAETLLPAVAMERIWQEFKKMSQFAHFDTGLITLHQLRLLPTIFPDLKEIPVEEIQNRVKAIERFPKRTPTIAELLELFPDSSLQKLLDLCDYLKLSRADKEFVEFYHRAQHLLSMPDRWQDKLEPIEWARFYADKHSEMILKIIAAHFALSDSEKFLEAHEKHRQLLSQPILRIVTQSPIVRAEHLIAEGIKPGKNLGLLLKEAERISVNQNIESRQIIITELKKTSFWK
ncbi:MAG TPA: CCA tRNA nucleotidyltransferase [Rhabdochlamydiaceae bacterium]|nr:CCA tRNA nucleotidyltransferase [Rhabdochlamydiaceae bacterium]